ncbi:MAG: hypothetical protein VX768_08275 [Planctomycetota bacterium]|nr:hypothetical protein [Planctomycetota bacterium]
MREDLASITCSRRLMEAGFDLSDSSMFKVSTLQEAQQMQHYLANEDARLKQQVAPFRQVLGARIMDAIEFMRSPKIYESSGEQATVASEIQAIILAWNCIIGLRQTFETFLFEIRVNLMLLSVIEEMIDEHIFNSVNAALSRLTDHMIQVRAATQHVSYPFDHGEGRISLSRFLVADLPTEKDVNATMDAAVDLEKNLMFLLRRCVARLGALAEKTETFFGFEPLEIPAEVTIEYREKIRRQKEEQESANPYR